MVGRPVRMLRVGGFATRREACVAEIRWLSRSETRPKGSCTRDGRCRRTRRSPPGRTLVTAGRVSNDLPPHLRCKPVGGLPVAGALTLACPVVAEPRLAARADHRGVFRKR